MHGRGAVFRFNAVGQRLTDIVETGSEWIAAFAVAPFYFFFGSPIKCI